MRSARQPFLTELARQEHARTGTRQNTTKKLQGVGWKLIIWMDYSFLFA
jgi:hypothetical protein